MSGDTYISSFVAKYDSNTSIALSWSGSFNTVTIEYSDDNANFSTILENTTSSATTVTGLSENTVYYFKITPYDTVYNAGTTHTLYITTTYSAAITGATTGTSTTSSIPVQWSGDFYTVKLRYKRTSDPETSYAEIYPLKGVSTYTLTGLKSDTSYNIQLIPYDIDDNSGSTYTVYSSTDYESYITETYLGTVTSTTIYMSWTGYYSYVALQYSTDETNWTTASTMNAAGSGTDTEGSYTFVLMDPDTIYYLRACPYDTNYNLGTVAYDVSTQTLCGFSYLAIDTISKDSIDISWNGRYTSVDVYVSYDSGNSYVLFETITASSSRGGAQSSSNSSSSAISGLEKDTNYQIYLVPMKNSVLGTSSEVLEITTDYDASASVTVGNVDIYSIPLIFDTNNIEYPYYDHCLIQISEDDSTYYDVSMIYSVPTTGNTISYTVTSIDGANLVPNFTYYLTIIPYSRLGTEGPESVSLSHATLGNIDAASVSLSVDDNVCVLYWSGYYKSTIIEYTTDNFAGGETVNSIQVYRDATVSSTTKDTTSNTYYLSSLSSATTYYFRLVPVNYNGDEGTATTSRYNATISTIYMSDISNDYITLKWDGTYNTVDVNYSSDNSTYTTYSSGISGNTATISSTSIGSSTTYMQVVPYNDNGEAGRTSNTTYSPTINNINLTVVDSSSITVSWSGTYDYVSIQYSSDGDNDESYKFAITDISGTNSATISPEYVGSAFDLSSNVYYYRIAPYRLGTPTTYRNRGVYSSTTYNATITQAYFSTVTYYTITLYWTGIYNKLYIYYDSDAGFSNATYTEFTTANTTNSLSSTTFSGLSSNTTYYFKFVPYNDNNETGYTAPSIYTSTMTLLSGLNFAYSAADSSDNYVYLTWSNNGYSLLNLYDSNGSLKLSSSSQTYYQDTGLTANQSYGYYVLVYDYNGNYETSSTVYAYTNPSTSGLGFSQVIYDVDAPSGYSLSARRVLFTWTNTGYYTSIAFTNTTAGGSTTTITAASGTVVYDSSANGEGLLIQNKAYTYMIVLTGGTSAANTTFTTTATTFGSISSYAFVNAGSYLITSASLPISFTGIFNSVILQVSDGTTIGNVALYGIGSGTSSVSYAYTLDSSNSIVSVANKNYTVNIYTINDASYTYLSTTTATSAYTLAKMTAFSTALVFDSSTIALSWDGSYNSVGIERTTASDFKSAAVTSQRISGSAKSTIYYFAGLLPNKKYYFRATPINKPLTTGSDVSGVSVTYDVSGTTHGKLTSFAIGSLTDISSDAISLTWDGSYGSVYIAVSSDGGVTYTATSGSPYSGKKTTITGLDWANYLYYFRATPINDVGVYSNFTTGGVYAYTRGKMTDTYWTETADTSSVLFYWDGSYSGVTVEYSTRSNFSRDIVYRTFTSTTSSKTYTIDGLSTYKTYYFRVKPYNQPTTTSGNIYGLYSSIITAYTWGEITSVAVDVSNTTTYSIPLTWDGSYNAVLVAPSSDGGVTYLDASAVTVYGKTTTFSNLSGFKTYYFRVYPINDFSANGAYVETTGTTLAYIGNVYATSVTAVGFTVNLSDSGYSSFYVVNNTTGTKYGATGDSSLTLSDMSANNSYTVTAYAYNYTEIDGCGNTVSFTLSNTKTLASITGVTTDVSTSYYSVLLKGYYTSYKIRYLIDDVYYDSSYVSYGSKITVYDLSSNTMYSYIIYANNYSSGAGTDVSAAFTVTTAGEIASSFSAQTNYSDVNSIAFNVYQGSFTAIRIKTATDSAFSNILYSVDISYDDILTLGNAYVQTGLSENKSYYFIAVALNSAGQEGSTSTTLNLSTLGNIYTTGYDTKGTAVSVSSLPIKWSGTYYKALVEYAPVLNSSVGSYSTYAYYTNDSSATSVAVSGNTNVLGLSYANTQYYFRVTPLSNDLVSGTSAVLTDVSCVTLGYVTSITSTAIYDSSASFLVDGSFSWVQVYSSPASLVKTYAYVDGGVSTDYDVSGLVYDTSYTFYFRAVNSNGLTNPLGGWSAAAPSTYLAIRTEPKITRFYVDRSSTITSSAIGVKFDGSYSTILLEYSVDNTNYVTAYSAATGYSATVSGLSPNTRYYFRATPTKNSAVGNTVYMSDTSAVTLATVSSIAVASVVYDSSLTIAVDGSFSAVRVYSTPASIVKIYSYVSAADGGLTTGYDISGLLYDTSYTFYFAPINSYGSSNTAGIASYKVLTGPKLTRFALTSSVTGMASIDSSSIALTFDGSYASILLEYSTDNATFTTAYSAATGKTATVAGLSPNTQYYFRATPARYALTGSTLYVSDASAVTLGTVTSTALTSTVYDSSLTLAVDGSFTSVRVYSVPSSSSKIYSYVSAADGGITTGYDISGLLYDTSYTFYFVPINSYGRSNTASIVTYKVLTGPKLTRFALTSSVTGMAGIDSSSITVAFDGSYASILLEYSTDNVTFSTAYSAATGYSATVASLAANTRYYFRATPARYALTGSSLYVNDTSAITLANVTSTSATSAVYDSSLTLAVDGSFTAVRVYSIPASVTRTYTYKSVASGGTTTGYDISGLLYDTSYTFYFVPINSYGSSNTAGIATYSVLTGPKLTRFALSTSTSTGMAATMGIDSSSITVAFDGSYASILLEYSSDNVTFSTAFSAATGKSATVASLAANTRYYFRATPARYALSGRMLYIADTSAVTLATVKSTTVTSTVYDSSLTLAVDGSFAAVSIYSIPASMTRTYTYKSAGGTTTGYDISGLVYDTSYTFYFVPINSYGSSNTAGIATYSVLTGPKLTRFAVTGIASIDSSSITVAFDGSYASILLEYSTDNTTFSTAYSAATGYSATVASLAANTRYYFRATPARYALTGRSLYVNDTSAVTLATVTSTSLGSTVYDTSFTLAMDGSFAAVSVYSIPASVIRTYTYKSAAAGGVTTGYDISGLSYGTSYTFYLTPINSYGSSNTAGIATYTIMTSLKLTRFYLTSAAGIDTSSIGVSFDGTFSSILLEYSTDQVTYSTAYSAVSSTSATVAGLSPNTRYYFRATPTLNGVTGSISYLTDTSAVTLGSVSTASVSSTIYDSSFTLKIDGSFASVYVYSSPASVIRTYKYATGGATTGYDISGLTYGTYYTFYFTPFNSYGSQNAAGVTTSTIMSGLKLTRFALSGAAGIDSSSIAVVFDGSFSSILLEYSTDAANYTTAYSALTSYSATVAGLATNTRYYFRATPNVNGYIGNIAYITDSSAVTLGTVSTTALKTSIYDSSFTLAVDGSFADVLVYSSPASLSKTYRYVNGGVTTGYDISGLAYGTYYTFYFRPINSYGAENTGGTATYNIMTGLKVSRFYIASTSAVDSSSITVSLDGSYASVLLEYSTDAANYATGYSVTGYSATVAGLLPNTRYYFRATPARYDVCGNVAYLTDTSAVTLATVTSTSATSSVYDSSLTLAVDGSFASVRIYSVPASVTRTYTYKSAAAGGVTTGYDVSGLLYDTSYTFYFVPVNSYGSSNTSATIATYSVLTGPKLTRFALTGSAIDSSSIALTFDGSYASILLEYSTDNAIFTTAYSAATGYSATVSGLLPNTRYYFRATPARYALTGSSLYVNDTSAVTLATVTSTAVASTVYDSSFTLTVDGSFTAVSVYSSPASVIRTYTYTAGGVSTGYDISGLVYGSTYYFYFTPINSYGLSNTAGIATYGIMTALKLTNFYLTNAAGIDSSSIAVSFDGSYSSVLLEYSTDQVTYTTAYSAITAYSATINGLAANQRYYLRATPNNNGVTGSIAYIKDTSATTLGRVTSTSYVGTVYDSSFTLAVDGSFASVSVYSSPASIVKTYTYTSGGVTTGYDISGLTYDTAYTFYYTPINSYGWANTAGVTSYSIMTGLRLSKFSLTGASSIDSSSISVTLAGTYTSVLLEYSTDAANYTTAYSAATAKTLVVAGLSPNTRYYFRATPSKSGVPGSISYISDSSAITLGKVTKTSTVGTIYDSSFTIAVDGSFSQVRVYSSPASVTRTYTAVTGGLTTGYDISGLVYDTSYTFYFVPINSYGWSNTAAPIASYSVRSAPKLTRFALSSKSAGIDSSSIAVVFDGSYASIMLEYSTDNVTYTTAFSAATGYSATVTGLTPNTRYYFRATPARYSLTGRTLYVSDTSAVTLATVKSTAIASTVYDSSLTLMVDGSFAYVSVYSVPASLTRTYTYTSGGVTTAYDVSGLLYDTSYTFYFTPVNSYGSQNTTSTTAISVLTAPKLTRFALTGSAIDSSSITVAFDGSYASVLLEYSTDNATFTTAYSAATGYSATVASLAANTRYYFRATPARYALTGRSIYVADTSAVTLGTIKSTVIASTVYDSSLTIAVDGSFAAVSVYSVPASVTRTYTYMSSAVGGVTTGYDISGLLYDTSYTFYFVPVNSYGRSNTAGITTFSVLTAPKLTRFALSTGTAAIDSSSITVAFDGSYASVLLEYSTDNATFTTAYSAATGYSATVASLAANTRYYFRATPARYALTGRSIYVADTSAVTLATITSTNITSAIYDSSFTFKVDGLFSQVAVYSNPSSLTKTYAYTSGGVSTAYDISGLQYNTSYTFYFVPYNSYGYAGTTYSYSSSTASKLTRLYLTSASAIDSSSIGVSWDGSFSSVALEYSTDNTTYTTAYSSVTSYSTVVYGLSANTRYYFRATPTSNGVSGNSSYLTDNSATTLPTINTPVVKSTVYDSSMTLTVDGSYSYVSIYSVPASLVRTYTYMSSAVGGVTTAYDISCLVYDTSYTFYFTPANSYGRAATTTSISVLTAPKLTRFYLKNAATIDSSSITVVFDGSYASIMLEYSTDQTTYTTAYSAATGYSATVAGLMPNTRYYFRATPARYALSGRSLYVSDTSAVTLATVKSMTVSSSVYDSSFTLAVDGSFTAVTMYSVPASAARTYTYTSSAVGGVTTAYDISGLVYDTSYTFYFTPINSYGRVATTTSIAVLTAPKLTRFALTSATGIDSSSIVLTFDGSYASVMLEYSTDQTTYTTAYSAATGYSATVAGLSPNTRYYFRATPARYALTGRSLYVNDTSAVTLPIINTPVVKSSVYDSSFTLAVDGSFAAVVMYSVPASAARTYTYTSSAVGGVTTAYDISGLVYDTSYTFYFTPYNSYGRAATTTSIAVLTAPKLTRFYLKNAATIDSSSITVMFDGSYASVLLEYSTDNANYVTAYSAATGYSATVAGLSANTRYYFRATPARYALSGRSLYVSDTSAVTSPTLASITSVFYDTSAALTIDGSFSRVNIYRASGPYVNATYTYSSAGGITTGVKDISNLSPNSSYTFTITAYNTYNKGVTASYTLTTLPNVTKFSASTYDTSGITVTWDGSYSYVSVVYNKTGTTFATTDSSFVVTGYTAYSRTVGGLSSNTRYYFRITPTGTSGTGYTSDASAVTMGDLSAIIVATVRYS